jgi:hypothetical protein
MQTNHHVYSVGKQRSLGMMDDMHRSRLSYRHAGTAREEETNGGAWIDAGSRLIMLLWCSTMALQWSPPSIVFALGSWVLIELAHAKPVCDAWRAMAFDPTTFTRNQTYILLLFHQFIMHRRRMSCHMFPAAKATAATAALSMSMWLSYQSMQRWAAGQLK